MLSSAWGVKLEVFTVRILRSISCHIWLWLSGKLRDLYAGHRGSNPGPAGDFMSRHMPPASPQEVGARCIVCPFVFQWHWRRCTCLENCNVVNVDVNPFPSPHFPFPSIARCWWGCSPLQGMEFNSVYKLKASNTNTILLYCCDLSRSSCREEHELCSRTKNQLLLYLKMSTPCYVLLSFVILECFWLHFS